MALSERRPALVSTAELEAIRNTVAGAEPTFLADLERLVNTDCGSYTKAGVDTVGTWTAERLRTLGFTVTRHPNDDGLGDTVIGELRGTDPTGPTLLCVAHLDTVFDEGTAAQRPFRIDGGIATGPGVTDMKAGLLAGLYAIAALRDTLGGVPLARLHAPHPAPGRGGRRLPGPRVCPGERRHRLVAQGEPGAGGDGAWPGGACGRGAGKGPQRDPRGGPDRAGHPCAHRALAGGHGQRRRDRGRPPSQRSRRTVHARGRPARGGPGVAGGGRGGAARPHRAPDRARHHAHRRGERPP